MPLPDRYDTLVVGAGFAGSIMAERLASRCGHRVLVVDRRDHIAGNAYDLHDEHGVLIHQYGPHIFHANAPRITNYLSNFTEWHPYEHRVVARLGDQHVPMPINRTTLNQLYGLSMTTDQQVADFYSERAEHRDEIRNSEDVVVAKVGRELYETFFKGYTQKQWERDPSELAASVCARIPLRTNDDDRYFGDSFQNMPKAGYTAMFRRILDHPLIDVRVGVDYRDVVGEVEHDHLVYTGPIDEYFGFSAGKLPYRSLEFETTSTPTPGGELLQPTGTVNYPGLDVPWTRITEYRHLTGQSPHPYTTMHKEHPRSEGDPYYPIPNDETKALYQVYKAMGDSDPGVTFVGRLARYQYLNMDQVAGQALSTFERLVTSGQVTSKAVDRELVGPEVAAEDPVA